MDDRFSRMESALHQLMAATVQRQQDLVQLSKAFREPVPEFQPHSIRPHGFPLSKPSVPSVFSSSVPTAPVGLGGPEPIRLARTPLTSEERDKRLTMNLCLYCGQRGHFVNRCPAKGQSPQVSRNILVSSAMDTTSPSRPILSGELLLPAQGQTRASCIGPSLFGWDSIQRDCQCRSPPEPWMGTCWGG